MHLILDENFREVDTLNNERFEQILVSNWIEKNDCVLEIGARYGSVSCIINSKLKNKKNQVVIEPDERVWKALEFNKNVNNCHFTIIKGFLSRKKLSLTNLEECRGYGTQSQLDEVSAIPTVTLEDLNMNFNVLVADCEGFLETFFDENPDFIKSLRLVIFEADAEERCDYNKIREKLKADNFEQKLGGFQNVWIKQLDNI